MAFTQVTTTNLDTTVSTQIAAGVTAATVVSSIVSMAIANVQVANSSYVALDDTAVSTAGGYVIINGSGFVASSTVIVGTVNATSTTYVSSSVIQAQVPAQAAASYPLYVVAPNGATAIRVNGITYSAFPAWSTGSTLPSVETATSFGVNLSATSDSTVTYGNTTSLPIGTTLAANGYFYGTVTIASQTTYSFDVRATDVENQDTSRTFSLTVTIVPQIRVYSWGDNTYGQLGTNNVIGTSSPAQVGSLTNWSDVVTRGGFYENVGGAALAIKNDGTLWSWGRNDLALLGTNDGINRSSPVQVGALTGWSKISVSGNHALAIRTNGTLWAWGTSSHGQLSTSTTGSPTQVGTDTNWAWVEAGRNVSFAIRTNGTLWSWGQGFFGTLGHNNVYNVSNSPKQIGTSTDWSKISCMYISPLALKTDGTIWSWGQNNVGQNGLSTQGGYRSSPTQIGTDNTWLKVNTGYAQMYGIKTDGTLWAWGSAVRGTNQDNYSGVIPLGNNRSSPSQVGSDTWLNVFGGYCSAFAVKTNGTLWAWGANQQGQLGLNNTTNQGSPLQVGSGTNWTKAVNHSNWSVGITTN